jgi:hypothetical protein
LGSSANTEGIAMASNITAAINKAVSFFTIDSSFIFSLSFALLFYLT